LIAIALGLNDGSNRTIGTKAGSIISGSVVASFLKKVDVYTPPTEIPLNVDNNTNLVCPIKNQVSNRDSQAV
jgi:hypothetical protein